VKIGDRGEGKSGFARMAMEAVEDGRVQFSPARYKDTYLDWLAEKRDWCISRQLWWGHRIPMWTAEFSQTAISERSSSAEIRSKAIELIGKLQAAFDELANVAGCPGEFCVRPPEEGSPTRCYVCVLSDNAEKQLVDVARGLPTAHFGSRGSTLVPATWSSDPRYAAIQKIQALGCEFVRDPDVLDTWFSSQLWPHATFGWPERTPELAYYYPTSVLV